MQRRFRLLLAALAIATSAAAPAPEEHRIERVAPIPLHPGANTIARLAPDGRDGLIALGWRENGNAYSHSVLLVMLRGRDGRFVVAPVERPDQTASETIADEPHTGEDAVRSVRLARASVDGAPATLLLTATREIDPAQGIAAPSLVVFDVFRLVHDADAVGGSPDAFRPLQRSRSSTRFCSAAVALRSRFGLAAAPGEQTQTQDGC